MGGLQIIFTVFSVFNFKSISELYWTTEKLRSYLQLVAKSSGCSLLSDLFLHDCRSKFGNVAAANLHVLCSSRQMNVDADTREGIDKLCSP